MSGSGHHRDEPPGVLIAGGGVAALETMLALRALAPGLVRTELLAPEPLFWYRPLSVAEPFDAGRAHHFELAQLAAEAGATFTPGALAAVDAEQRLVRTAAGSEIPYDVLVLALGAVPRPWLDGALTFRGPADADTFRSLLGEVEAGSIGQVTFVVPAFVSWQLPLYELALMTAAHVAPLELRPELAVVTHEDEPLSLFGVAASKALRQLLSGRGVDLHTGTHVLSYDGEALALVGEQRLGAERVVTLPRLEGERIDGIPCDAAGFVPVDHVGRVRGLRGVFAAGDITAFPVKQGGLAAQAADAVAAAIAAGAGAPVTPEPFRPVLRGLLLTGGRAAFMRAELSGGHGQEALVSDEPLWWPPAKIVGRYLAPVLARALPYADAAPPADGIPVQVDLSQVQHNAV